MSSNERDWFLGGPDTEVEVLLEPTGDHSAEDVVARLHEAGVVRADVLSPGFVSARATRDALRSVESMATVHPKATKGPRRRP